MAKSLAAVAIKPLAVVAKPLAEQLLPRLRSDNVVGDNVVGDNVGGDSLLINSDIRGFLRNFAVISYN